MLLLLIARQTAPLGIAVILFVIFMSIWFSRFFKRKMDESVQEQQRLQAKQRAPR